MRLSIRKRVFLSIFIFGVILYTPSFGGQDGTCATGFAELVRKVVIEKSFQTGRHLTEYLGQFMRAFGDKFPKALKRLGPQDTWFDGGSGSGLMLMEFHAVPGPAGEAGRVVEPLAHYESVNQAMWDIASKPPRDRPQTLGFTLTEEPGEFPVDRWGLDLVESDTSVQAPAKGLVVPAELPKHRLMKDGRFFEDVPMSEIGKANLITDFYGILAYTHDISAVLNRYLEMLPANGEIFIHLNADTKINGKTLGEFLKTIPGLEVEESLQHGVTVRVKKLAPIVKIPPLRLNPLTFKAGSPPHREFLSN